MELYLGAIFNNRNISTMNVLSQDSLLSKKFTIKCDIIEARNASKQQKSDLYLNNCIIN